LAARSSVSVLVTCWRLRLPPRPSGYVQWPHGEAAAFLATKVVRDITAGLIGLILLISGQRQALGLALLAAAFIPLGDAIIVISYGGSPSIAYGVHGITAVVLVVVAVLQLRELPAYDRSVLRI
jgi:hypothetical protein